MPKTRILIVDDAVVVRRLLSDALGADPELEVVGTAPDGRIALAKIAQLVPDLVILDVEMPEMDGLATLAAIRATNPALPVLMFSSLTERGAPATLELLALGASDYATKPSDFAGIEAAAQFVRRELIPKVKALCGAPTQEGPPAPAGPPPAPGSRPDKAATGRTPIEVVAIAASTGGPFALTALLPALPADFPVPLVIVQHMPPMFTKLLADRLSQQSAIAIREAQAGDVPRPGGAWLAPGDHHMVLCREGDAVRIQTHQGAMENSCRPSADVLFRSVAEAHAGRVLAVILTGMGRDGLRGCERVRQAGGQILAQDQATSVVWGMPGHVARAGLADMVLPLEHLATEITRRARAGRTTSGGT
jgi:two-component system chemotaxis response regulator CheB